MHQQNALPPIRLISFPPSSTPQQLPPAPTDMRKLRVEEFLKARSLSANSQKAYRRELGQFLTWTERSFAEITPRQIAQFKAHLLEKGLAVTSVNRALATLKSFFKWLHQAYPELIESNPTPAVSMEKVPLPPARDLSPQEIAALHDALKYRGDYQIRDTALLAILSHGLRASEVCGLDVRDYDGVRLAIRQAKDDSTATVPLTATARCALDSYLE